MLTEERKVVAVSQGSLLQTNIGWPLLRGEWWLHLISEVVDELLVVGGVRHCARNPSDVEIFGPAVVKPKDHRDLCTTDHQSVLGTITLRSDTARRAAGSALQAMTEALSVLPGEALPADRQGTA